MRALARFATASLASALLLATHAGAVQDPTLDEVLARAGAYVTQFQRLLSGVVAEETYVQDVYDSGSLTARGQTRLGATHRALKSDLLLVRPAGADRWIQFRDVFEVDGKAVRDRNERLMKLFVEPTASTAAQVDQIVKESARYNIGSVFRTINVPVFALMVLEPTRQSHFRFSRIKTTAVPGALARYLPNLADTWTIRYEEVGVETLITTANNRNLPSQGRFWIDPATGRVLASELNAVDVAVGAAIVVVYQSGVVKDVLVPAAMHEQYVERRNSNRIEGMATYSRFRQFQVKVDEKIAPIKE
jgi:hypothetical protein